jgi:hypothetical protein
MEFVALMVGEGLSYKPNCLITSGGDRYLMILPKVFFICFSPWGEGTHFYGK